MRLSSHEVEGVKFAVTLRGYAEDEVDALLDLVVATIGEYEDRDAKARSEIERLRSDIDECRKARLLEIRGPSSDRDAHVDVENRVAGMLEEAVRTSERVVEEALEAGEHILDQIRTALEPSLPGAERGRPDQHAEVDQNIPPVGAEGGLEGIMERDPQPGPSGLASGPLGPEGLFDRHS